MFFSSCFIYETFSALLFLVMYANIFFIKKLSFSKIFSQKYSVENTFIYLQLMIAFVNEPLIR